MSVGGLRMELEAIDREIALTRQDGARLGEDEKTAVEHHDRVALDRAWVEHDSRLEQLRTLQERQAQTRRELVREAELDVERWRSKAQVRVQQWQDESQELLLRLSGSIAQIEDMLAEVQERPEHYHNERTQLLDELAALRPTDLAADLSEPEIDWSVRGLELDPIARRLAELASRCRAMAPQ